MAREIIESDWKVLRELHGIALERFCKRVLEDVRSAIESCSGDYHDCYSTVTNLMRNRDKQLARIFDDLRRSTALIVLIGIKTADLLTEDEWMRFSVETREAIDQIVRSARDR